MDITDIRIRLLERPTEAGRFLADASFVIDGEFVVKGLKVILGDTGPFVAMPSRLLTDRCPCGYKNPVTDRFCGDCGQRLAEGRARVDPQGRPQLYADIAHPIKSKFRDRLNAAVLAAYEDELWVGREVG